METSLPKFSRAAQKIVVAQNLGGLQPPSPPRPVRLCPILIRWIVIYQVDSTIQRLNNRGQIVNSLPFNIPDASQRYSFMAKPPRISH